MNAKFLLFVLGALTAVVGAIGLAFSFEFVPAFLAALPKDPRIYFGLALLFGLIGIGASFSKPVL